MSKDASGPRPLLGAHGPRTRFTAAPLRELHRSWLGGVDECTGKDRAAELQKGELSWPPAFCVADDMAASDADLPRARAHRRAPAV